MKPAPAYDGSAIEVLTTMQAIRRRPSMYIGALGAAGLRHLLTELVQNAIDEALDGWCRRIRVTAERGGYRVEDDGRGIPVDVIDGRSALELVMTEPFSSAKFREGAYSRSGGLHGLGLCCVNALSERLEVEVCRDGRRWRMDFSQGAPITPLQDLGPAPGSGPAAERGTSIFFRPDPLLFPGLHTLPRDSLVDWLQEQSLLNPGLSLELHQDGADTFRSADGLPGYAKTLAADRPFLHPRPLHLLAEIDLPQTADPYSGGRLRVEAALLWTRAYGGERRSYVNHVRTPLGGAHAEGMEEAIALVLLEAARPLLQPGERLLPADLLEGLCAVLSVRMRDPLFEGQTKLRLTADAVRPPVRDAVAAHLRAALAADPALGPALIGKALEAGRARDAARRAGERARYRSPDAVISKEAYREQFGIRSRDWHRSCRWLTDSALLGQHAALCAVAPDAEVLDVCCGSGVVGASFRGRVGRLTGLDLTPEMVRLSRERLDTVVQGDVYDIPFPDARFDLVVNREVLHLLPRPERPVAEIFRVLKPGGQLIVGQMLPYSAADAAWFFRIVKKKQPLFFNNLMEEDMLALLEGAGFTGITAAEYLQWEDIDLWINTWETPPLLRQEIRDLYHHAPAEARAAHPFRIEADGHIYDQWRWLVFSAFKPR